MQVARAHVELSISPRERRILRAACDVQRAVLIISTALPAWYLNVESRRSDRASHADLRVRGTSTRRGVCGTGAGDVGNARERWRTVHTDGHTDHCTALGETMSVRGNPRAQKRYNYDPIIFYAKLDHTGYRES